MNMRTNGGGAGETRLSLDAMTSDFVVDVANIVREQSLLGPRPADLSRLLLLLDALAEFACDEDVRVYGVCDSSLLRDTRLTPAERALLGSWADEGRIEVRPVADPRILELAEQLDMPAVTFDNFTDHIPGRPWIAGNTDTFLKPRNNPAGPGLVVVPRVLPVPEEWQISRKVEESDLLASGLYDRRGHGARTDLLSRLWRCADDACPLFGARRAAGQPMPRHQRGAVLCPTHETPLTAMGTVPARIQLKVRIDGTVRARFAVHEGETVTVGRAPAAAGGIALAALQGFGPAARNWISRNHLTVTFTGDRALVRDTSSNGTVVERRGPDAKLRNGSEWVLRPGHRVLLHDTVALELSGRQHVFTEEAAAVPPTPLTSADTGPTLLHSPPRRGEQGSRGNQRGRTTRRHR
ncbi:FHA domain-containing protein [Streptomyces sp. NPDC059618]|uniref:FHA domain-containing protein n=1 Tax=Streptomyces sp. NPDC059618 TaxID=3346887 RepID=UPI0036C5EFE8